MPMKVYLEDLVRMGLMGHRMYVGRENFDSSTDLLVGPLTIQHMEPHSFVPQELAFMDDAKTQDTGFRVRDFLQAMSDAAWEIGIKPRGLEGHTDELKAVRYHLEDMRKLAKVKE